jgi:superfamily II DNA or RNA helicase
MERRGRLTALHSAAAVPLLDVLTIPRLRAMAGQAYVRGEDYWRQGRVLAFALSLDSLGGVVKGGETYRVLLKADAGRLVGTCTCPVGGPLCKHAVALGLAFLAQQDGPGKPTKPRSTAPAFETWKELDAWAKEHHVEHALSLSAETLCTQLPLEESNRSGFRFALSRLSMRHVGAREGAARYAGASGFEQAVVEAAYRELHQQAEAVRVGILEEEAREERSPDPELGRLWSRLVQARLAIREQAVPRSRAARATGVWLFEPLARAVAWKERDRVFRTHPDYGTAALGTRLTFSGTGEPRHECTCGARDGRCTHSLALIDATLDVLADPARVSEARTVAEELLRPGWARALEELDRFDATTAKPRTAIEVWWHVEHVLGSWTLSPTVKKQTRRGGMSAGARMAAGRLLDEHRDVLSEQDLRIAENAASWAPTSRAAGTYAVRAFVAAVGHPRILADDQPIEMKRVQLGFTAHASGEHILLEPSIGGERLSPKLLGALLKTFAPSEPLLTVEPELGRGLLVDVNDDARQLWSVLEKHGDAFPPESHVQLLERLARMESKLPLVVPHTLKGRELTSDATPVVRLRLLPDVTLELELLVRPGPGTPLFQPGSGPRDVLLVRDGERGYVRRQLLDEVGRARAALVGLPLESAEEGPPFCFRIGNTNEALQLVAALQAPRPGLDVEWVETRAFVSSAVGPEALRVSVERKRDWFGLDGDLKVEAGRLELAVLLDAARRQQRFVRVDENRWVELSEALRQRLLAVADQTFTTRNRLELSPGAVPAIRALAAAGAQIDTAPAWQELTDRLAASASLVPKPPAALARVLRDYQVEGHAWLSRIAAWGAGACLADDMGLGKTVQAIALLLDRAKLGPALVLAPTSVAYNWVQELERFAPTLRPVLYAEQADRAACVAKLRHKDVLIVSYGLLVRDAALLASRTFSTLVVDEAQALKNPNTRRARAARSLDASFRIALSGTPFENHLGELWSLFAIVFPGLLGSWEQFRERYAAPIERDKDPNARAALSRVLRPFLLRRTKQEVARELPSRTEIQVPVALSKDEWSLYEDARLAAVAEVTRQGKGVRNEQQRFQVLAALTRLRLLASHPKLYDGQSTVASSKMRRLLELLEELRTEGHRALVFSQFTSHLALVREALDKAGFSYLYLDGSTPAGKRAKLVEAFQDGEGELFLISLKAGGTGINLTGADYVIHLDPWWNPAVEDQATDRAHRIGQTKPVTVYRLITRGTIEEQILAMHGDKRELVAGILEGTDVAARLTTRDLLRLLQAGDKPPAVDDEPARDRPVLRLVP